MQPQTESRRIFARPFRYRERRAAFLRSAQYFIATLPPWFIFPVSGDMKDASPEFMQNYFRFLTFLWAPRDLGEQLKKAAT